jgi:hypothetical protein
MVDTPPNLPVTLQGPTPPPNYRQYLRKVGLVIYGGQQAVQGPTQGAATLGTAANGIDVSNMRITFQVRQFDAATPNLATIRVYNLSDKTALMIQKEFQYVALQAGYEGGNYGQIFQGTVKQFKKGRIDAITTFLEMFCSDGDQAWNFAQVNSSFAAGTTFQQQINAIMKTSMSQFLTAPQTPELPQGLGGLTTARGRVSFGIAQSTLNDLALSTNTTFKIVNGQVIFTTMTGYDPGAAIQLNVESGLVLVPEATDNGIEVTALLNPALRCGRRVQINNRDINTNILTGAGALVQPTILAFPARVADDGFYRVIVADHEGDSRGGPSWFTRMTCLALTSEDGQVATGG